MAGHLYRRGWQMAALNPPNPPYAMPSCAIPPWPRLGLGVLGVGGGVPGVLIQGVVGGMLGGLVGGVVAGISGVLGVLRL